MSRRRDIEESLELAAAHGVDLAPLVYARLFIAMPEVEASFCLDRNGAVRGSMLNHALDVVLDLTGDRAYAEAFLRSEAVNHGATHGIDCEVFVNFYDHLVAVVRELAGPDWTAAMENAWREATEDVRRLARAV